MWCMKFIFRLYKDEPLVPTCGRGSVLNFKIHKVNIMDKREFNPLDSEHFWPSFFDSFPKSSHYHPRHAHMLHTENEILLLVLFQCMEQCLVMSFVNNIIFNQACPSCGMSERINEASKETNEDNAASTISRQPTKKTSASTRQRRKQQMEERWRAKASY